MTPPDAPVVRMAELRIDPAWRDRYVAAVRAEIVESLRIEPGVLAIHAVADKQDPCLMRFFEIYADEAAYAAHIASAHFRRYAEATRDMITAKRLIETLPIQLGARPV